MREERSTAARTRAVRGKARGHVQGVGFRWFVCRAAHGLGLAGFVRNVADGTVEFVAQGRSEDVERLLVCVAQGPPGARVETLETADIAPDPALGAFDVRRG